MTIADRAVLVTGANRGIGRALVEEALRRGAKRVYAGTRQPLTHPDERVTPLTLDMTKTISRVGSINTASPIPSGRATSSRSASEIGFPVARRTISPMM